VHQDALQGFFFGLPTCASKGACRQEGLYSGRQKELRVLSRGVGRIDACLKNHFADVSDQCKETISQSAGKS
jgi:hypothetical protein